MLEFSLTPTQCIIDDEAQGITEVIVDEEFLSLKRAKSIHGKWGEGVGLVQLAGVHCRRDACDM